MGSVIKQSEEKTREKPRAGGSEILKDGWALIKDWFNAHPPYLCLVVAILLNFTIECLSFRSIFGGFSALFTNFFIFAYNTFILYCTLSFSLLFKKRDFALALISFIWLGLGVADCVLLQFRTAPLAAIDFALLFSVFSILGIYLTTLEIILIIAAIVAVAALFVYFFLRCKPKRVRYARCISSILVSCAILVVATSSGLHTSFLPDSFSVLTDAYHDYGFAYCFSRSVIDRGIDKPGDYSDASVTDLADDLEEASAPAAGKKYPNIIMLQLESFIDVNHLTGVTFSQNPVPNFTMLKAMFPSGFLTVPSVGAGTANTEFEVLTGMSLDYFGTGEYPYTTVLKSSTCESICYNLKELGYGTHAVHNNTAIFYDRDKVFPNLGFDTFTSLEYMENAVINPYGWANDQVLSEEILKALASTKGQDLVYTISVQGHGKYPTEPPETPYPITVDSATAEFLQSEAALAGFEYYVNQLFEMDQFIRDLVTRLSEFDEPTILVLYGDHLPSFDIGEEDLDNQNIFQTEYIIWSNFRLDAADRDLAAFQLSAHVLGLCQFDNGLLTKLHQSYETDPDYLSNLELLEYDMLYGDHIVYNGEIPYAPTELKMGVSEIAVYNLTVYDEAAYISGAGFTPYSAVFINGEKQESDYINAHTLRIAGFDAEPGCEVVVSQLAGTEVLSSSDGYIANFH